MIGSSGRSSFFSAPLGVSVLVVVGGGGLWWRSWGGLVGLGAGTAFVGRAVVVVGGGLGLLGRGIAPSSLSSDDSKENFRFLGAGWGGLGFAWGGGGGVGAVVVDASPRLLPLAHPAPTHAPPHLLIPPPPRVPHLLHPSPLTHAAATLSHTPIL